MEYRLHMGPWNSVFAVPTALVDRYLKLAGKEQLQVLLWMLRHKDSTVDPSSSRLTTYVFLAIVAILMVLGLVMLLQARKNGGVWSLAGREVRVLPAEAGYSLIFLTLAVNVVAVAAAAVMGGNVGYYLIYVLVAWLFALLVYYTVKMM